MTFSDIRIRKAQKDDKLQLAGVFETAIRSIASRFYSDDQIDAWAGRKRNFVRVFIDRFGHREAWVAEDLSGRLLAYIDLEIDGHIDFFYALPEVSKTNVTRDLYKTLEHSARNQNLPLLYTEASEAARRFFEKQEFVMTTKNDLWIGEVSIHNYSMEKML